MLDFGFYNLDCMEGMKDYPDNYFDLAVVDPPYGGGLTENGGCQGWFSKYHQETPENSGGGTEILQPFRTTFRPIQTKRGEWHGKHKYHGESSKKIITWDTAPDKSYFQELFRVSRNQIIWGGELL